MTDYRNKFLNNKEKKTLIDSVKKQELFDRGGKNLLKPTNSDDYLLHAESERFVKAFIKQKTRYIPEIDYTSPETFCFYGSAERYYKDSIERIYKTYPYDGSKAEKMEWTLTASYMDLHVLESEYPKEKGHVVFSSAGWGTQTASDGDYGLSSNPEYIYFVGGPHSGTIFNSSKKRENNLKIDGGYGNTAEFWLKKRDYVSSLTTKEVIFDVHTSGAISGSSTYGRFMVSLDSSVSSGSPFKLTYVSGTTGITDQVIGSSISKSSVADNEWHHYAITVLHSGSSLVSKLYVDGTLEDTNSESISTFGSIDRNFVGTIGSLATASNGSGKIGYGKLSASLDEFRYWKTARDEKQIALNWYRPVHGGTDLDNTNPNLGLYYKFNEGSTGVETDDKVILDYSGRINNGSVTGWSSTFRSSSSGIELSKNLPDQNYLEPGDPIINPSNSRVQATIEKLKKIGQSHDINNPSSLANTVPHYFMSEDSTGLMAELVQIISSTLDDLFLKIKFLPKIKDYNYQDFFDKTGIHKSSDTNNFLLGCEGTFDHEYNGSKYKPWISQVLEHFGMVTTDVFSKSSLMETFLSRTEELNFEQNLHEVKSAILSNIHSNLIHIYNTKGTERSFRNIIRCFGIDDELIKLNVYGNNEVYKIEKKPVYTTVKQKSLNFANENYKGTLYQTASNNLYQEQRYFTGSTTPKPITVEANIIFPDQTSLNTTLQSASLFGMHSVHGASGSSDALTWHTSDNASFQTYFVRRNDTKGDGYFFLTSSNGTFQAISSSYIPDVYDTSHWNISVRVAKKGDIDFGLNKLSGSGTYKVEFAGYNYDLDVLKNSFYVTSSITRQQYEDFSRLDRAVYAGSHKTNFSGSHLTSTDIRLLGMNVWLDGLSEDELKEHAKNPSIYGRTNPDHISNFDDGSNLRSSDSLILRWQFENHYSSSAGGTLTVTDYTSGSASTVSGSIVGFRYNGHASGFSATGSAIAQDFVASVEYAPIDNVYSSDRVKVKNTELEKFESDSRPVTYFYSFEKSMYQVISKEMIKFFAGVTGMSNIIGEPVNKYRKEYKAMEKLKEKFFQNVENDVDLDKFVDYYRWIDSSVSHFVQQLVPASAHFAGRIRDVVESHMLERSKYKYQPPNFEYKDPTTKPTNILGVNELLYDWEHGHAPLSGDENENCLWQKERSERDNDNRQTLNRIITSDVSGSTYAIRRFSRPYRFGVEQSTPVKAGFNRETNKNPDLYKASTKAGNITLDSDRLQELIPCSDVLDPNKVEHYSGPTNIQGKDSYLNADSDMMFPFTMISSSVGVDLDQFKENMKIANNHLDIGIHGEQSLQGPFTRQHVGGMPHRKVKFGITSSADRPEAYHLTAAANQLILTSASLSEPKSMFHRDLGYQPSYVFKNIQHTTASSILGNYNKDYEIVQTAGRTQNNSRIVDLDGQFFNPINNSYSINEYALNIGTDQYISVDDADSLSFGDSATDSPFSLSIWFMVTASYMGVHTLLHKGADGNSTEWKVTIVNDDLRLSIYDADSQSYITYGQSFAAGMVTDTWYNVVVTYDGSAAYTGMTMYLNGSSMGPFGPSSNNNINYDAMGNDTGNLYFGASILSDDPRYELKGKLADVILFDKELSAVEVTEVYNGNAVVNAASLTTYSDIVSWWKMGDGIDTLTDTDGIRDYVGSNHGSSSAGVSLYTATSLSSDTVTDTEYLINASPSMDVVDYKNQFESVRSSEQIIVNKFSSPGGPETSGYFANNYESNEYSLYNTLNYRNRTVRDALNKFSSEFATVDSGRESILNSRASASIGFPGHYFSTNPLGWYNRPSVGQTYQIISTDGTSVTYTGVSGTPDFTLNQFNAQPGLNGRQDTYQLIADSLAQAINHPSGHAGKITATVGGPYGTSVILKQSTAGTLGNTTITEANGGYLTTASIEQFAGGNGAQTSQMASLHMTNRNPSRTTGSAGNIFKYDNNFVQHMIPQSDYQYSWITASVSDSVYNFVARNNNFGYVHEFSLGNGSSSSDQIGFATSSFHRSYHRQSEDLTANTLMFRSMISASATSVFSGKLATLYSGPLLTSDPTATLGFGDGSSSDEPFSVSVWIKGFTDSEFSDSNSDAYFYNVTSNTSWWDFLGSPGGGAQTGTITSWPQAQIFGKDTVWSLFAGKKVGQGRTIVGKEQLATFRFAIGTISQAVNQNSNLYPNNNYLEIAMNPYLADSLYRSGKLFNISVTYDGSGANTGFNMFVNGRLLRNAQTSTNSDLYTSYVNRSLNHTGYNLSASATQPINVGHSKYIKNNEITNDPADQYYGFRGASCFYGEIVAPTIFSKKLSQTEVLEAYNLSVSKNYPNWSHWPNYDDLSYKDSLAFFVPSARSGRDDKYSLSGSTTQVLDYADIEADSNKITDVIAGIALSSSSNRSGTPAADTYNYRTLQWDDDRIFVKKSTTGIKLNPLDSSFTVNSSENIISSEEKVLEKGYKLQSLLSPVSLSSWKQIRGYENPITRKHIKENTISISVRGSELFPSSRGVYEFDSNSKLANINDYTKRTTDRTIQNYTEPMVTDRFAPMTVTLHNNIAGGLSYERIRIINEDAFLTQQEEQAAWNFEDDTYSLLTTNRPEEDGVSERSIDNRLFLLRQTYQNEMTKFANPELNSKLRIDEVYEHEFDDLLFNIQRDVSVSDGVTVELNYVENIYPREENTYLEKVRLRENFKFFGWNSNRDNRVLLLTGSNIYNDSLVQGGVGGQIYPQITISKDNYKETNSMFVDAVDSNSTLFPSRYHHIQSSTWPLDSRQNFDVAPLSITSSYFIDGEDFMENRLQGIYGEGTLQNDYSIFGLGINTVHGTPPPAPVYNRRIPQTYGSNIYLAGEAKWQSAEQSNSRPFADSYSDHRESIRVLGQDHTIVPEFRISEFVEDTMNNYGGKYEISTNIANNYLSLTGALYQDADGNISIGSNFYKTYATSDFMKYFGLVLENISDENASNDLDPLRLTLKCQAAMKFTPYYGFYPAERVMQISKLFAKGYMPEFSFRNTGEDSRLPQADSGILNLIERKIRANMQQSMKPLFAPGILFNSIKSGLAVDYPLFGSTSDFTAASSFATSIASQQFPIQSFDSSLQSLTLFTGSIVSNTVSSVESGIPRLSGSVYRRVTFDDLLNPDQLKGVKIVDNEPHPSASIYYGNSETSRVFDYPFTFGKLDEGRTERLLNAAEFSVAKPLEKTLLPYKLAINNFCAETVKFFLEDSKVATIESDEVEITTKASTDYKMRVYLRNKDLIMYDRHSAFGPPVDEGKNVTFSEISSKSITISGSGASRDFGIAEYNFDILSGSNVNSDLPGFAFTGSNGGDASIRFVSSSHDILLTATNISTAVETSQGVKDVSSYGNL